MRGLNQDAPIVSSRGRGCGRFETLGTLDDFGRDIQETINEEAGVAASVAK